MSEVENKEGHIRDEAELTTQEAAEVPESRDQKRRQLLNDMTREAHEQGMNWD